MLHTLVLFLVHLVTLKEATYLNAACQPGGYQILAESERLFNTSVMSTLDDHKLQPGWYRFDGMGKQLKVGMEDLSTAFLLKDNFHPCGAQHIDTSVQITTSEIRVMKQPHPRVSDGIVLNTIDVCRYNAIRSECTGSSTSLKCTWTPTCTSKIDVYLQNCGEFFVYYLHPTTATSSNAKGGVYCTEETLSDPAVSPRLECQHYRNLTDPSRLWNATIVEGRFIGRQCQDSFFSKDWTRFLSTDGEDASIAEYCPSVVQNLTGLMDRPPCGALYRGWINGYHPAVGKLEKRQLCFSHPTTCDCQSSSEINIINCGAFYIYKRRTFPMCTARACTVLKQSAITPPTPPADQSVSQGDLCGRAVVVEDDTRFWNSINPTRAKCDGKFQQAVTFVTTKGDYLKLKEGCNTSDAVFPIGRCESKGAMWLNGEHPDAEMGVVPRFICIHRPRGYPASGGYNVCDCTIKRSILVQNCHTHFVYQLDPIEDCVGRYCLQQQDTINPAATVPCPAILPETPKLVTEKTKPFECHAENHQVLTNPERLFDNDVSSIFDDTRLLTGWYRFAGVNQQMQEGLPDVSDIPLPRVFARCGTQTVGQQTPNGAFFVTTNLHTLKQPHPKVVDGLVKRDVEICHYRALLFGPPSLKPCIQTQNGFNCFWKLECDENIPIYVRNCGDFHVYHLPPTIRPFNQPKGGVYCTSQSKTPTEVSPRLECLNYVNLTDSSRLWNSNEKPGVLTNNEIQDPLFTKHWTRFLASNATHIYDTSIPDKCVSVLSDTSNFTDRTPCGALYRGWMLDLHPTVEDGLLKTKLCFSHPKTCECQTHADISVINCGNFHIYKRNGFPLSNAKACTVPQTEVSIQSRAELEVSMDLCSSYKTVTDDSRFWTSTDPSNQQCDGGFKQPVQFLSTKGEYLKMKEGCNPMGVYFPVGKCQSNTVTWLEENHPNETDGPVIRSICIHQPGYPFFGNYQPCQCQSKQNILVQNCSNFFVYKLDGFKNCDVIKSRYCLQNTGKFKPVCKGKWGHWNLCSKNGKRTRYCYERNKFFFYVSKNISETENCQYVCKLSKYRYIHCVTGLNNVKKSDGEFGLPYWKTASSTQVSGSFSSTILVKKSENEVVCFNYRFEKFQEELNFTVEEKPISTGQLRIKFQSDMKVDFETRHCFNLSASISAGEQYQIVFRATSKATNLESLVYVNSYTVEARSNVPCDEGTNFHARSVLCEKEKKTPQCVVAKSIENKNIDWRWSLAEYIHLQANKTNSTQDISLQVLPIVKANQRYCFCMDVSSKVRTHGYCNLRTKMVVNQISGSDTTVIKRIPLQSGRLIHCVDVIKRQSCSKINIHTEVGDWSYDEFIRIHEVKLRNERCDHVPHGY